MIIDNFLSELECEELINYIKKRHEKYLSKDPKTHSMEPEIAIKFTNRLSEILKVNIGKHDRITFIQYGKDSQGLKPHIDYIENPEITHTCIIYLNDNHGDIVFNNFCITPKQGRLVIFNVSEKHSSLPPRKEKFAIIFRIKSPILNNTGIIDHHI